MQPAWGDDVGRGIHLSASARHDLQLWTAAGDARGAIALRLLDSGHVLPVQDVDGTGVSIVLSPPRRGSRWGALHLPPRRLAITPLRPSEVRLLPRRGHEPDPRGAPSSMDDWLRPDPLWGAMVIDVFNASVTSVPG